MFTTAGRTLFTTGENVVGMVAASRTGGAAAVTAASGARPACIAFPPTRAPAISMSTATIQIWFLVKRFIILSSSGGCKKMAQKNETNEIAVGENIGNNFPGAPTNFGD